MSRVTKLQLETATKESFYQGKVAGFEEGKKQTEQAMASIRKAAIVDLVKAASELAQANAKLTYAMSRISDKLL